MLPQFNSIKEKEKFFHSLTGEEKIQAFNDMIRESESIVFLGGAGVSTESGIPDFRSKVKIDAMALLEKEPNTSRYLCWKIII